ncbi:MAG: orotate phosphoribosyltransferase [Deltaproteobacteria bacterium DG_8]|nr:MAG: orotate phosphoribosyltransferase [Deltaproteobacteria bacterium DG_8]
MDDRARLLQLIKEKSYEERKVILSSGRESTFYFDGKQTTLNPEGSYITGKLLYQKIRNSSVPVEAVGGMTLGADPIVTSIAIVSFLEGNPLPAFIIRKEPKKHGTCKWIEGKANLPPQAKVAIVEDVVTTGRTTLQAISRAEEEGLQVIQVLALIDREEGGSQHLSQRGYKLESIFSHSDFKVR